ncbi:hypothetical protein ASPCADRAFT_401557 [Aspergillus carbonarius ITEM 5010]|uniref:Uncharacterized protein n=1 Tax=Aspergillus carbonarius (strain ITEM 5010) TaxID=602072 RepID=A0A1R3S1D5_ASPC5|nr:hypothetical protein ASPCADRAFT_401557 [Aspergillus carbonarius ITEM 5010]
MDNQVTEAEDKFDAGSDIFAGLPDLSDLLGFHSPDPCTEGQADPEAEPEAELYLLLGLPNDYITQDFSDFETLQEEARAIQKSLNANHNEGNQWLLIRNLPKSAICELTGDISPIPDIDYCFEWDGPTGLLKVIHSRFVHEQIITRITGIIDHQLKYMGVPGHDEGRFHKHTPFGTLNYGKNGDWIFTPPARRLDESEESSWPTLVIEAGVSESYGKLIKNAQWWFSSSIGEVRIVLLILMGREEVRFEKWQLRTVLVDGKIAQKQTEGSDDSPIVSQDFGQGAYCQQQVRVTETEVIGAPMVLPFEALYDRPARVSEVVDQGEVTEVMEWDIGIQEEQFQGIIQRISS